MNAITAAPRLSGRVIKRCRKKNSRGGFVRLSVITMRQPTTSGLARSAADCASCSGFASLRLLPVFLRRLRMHMQHARERNGSARQHSGATNAED